MNPSLSIAPILWSSPNAPARISAPAVWVIVGLLFAPALFAADAKQTGTAAIHPILFASVRTGVSRPLREMKGARPQPGAAASEQDRRTEHEQPSRAATAHGDRMHDPAVQSRSGNSGMPLPIQNFEGLGDLDLHPTPNTNVAAGPNEVGQILRFSYRIWDKAGNPLTDPIPSRTLWEGLEGSTCSPDGGGGVPGAPIGLYDQLADRWVWSVWALTSEVHQCVAVSVTGDPLGAYYQYDFLYPFSGLFGGEQKISMWPDAYYMTGINTGVPSSTTVLAFDRKAMLAGLPALGIGASLDDGSLSNLLSANLEGLRPPPTGPGNATAPGILMSLGHPDIDGSPTPRIHVRYFHPDFTDPGNSTLTGPVDLEVDPFDPIAGDVFGGGYVIPQPPPGVPLLAEVGLEYRLTYRNFGDHESIVVEHDVLTDGVHVAPRWYEVRDPLGSPLVQQQGTFAPDDGVWRWMASAAMDANDDIAIGYSVSNDTDVYPGIRYAGRLAGDPPGELSQGEAPLIAGDNPYTGTPDSQVGMDWGHNSSLVVDPDGCTFWYTAQYTPAAAGGDFGTRIGSFKFDSCTPGPGGTLEGTVTDGASPLENVMVTAGASSRFTDALGHYAFTIPAGAYDMTASKYGSLPTAVSGVAVSSGGDTVQNFVLSPAPTALVNGVVKDGSGGGWPLYARIEVSGSGAPTMATFSDPVTGYYSFVLVQGMGYIFKVTAVSPGYEPGEGVVPVGPAGTSSPGGQVVNWSLTADLLACSAPGYTLSTAGLAENFDAGVLPEGWSITNDIPDGQPWEIFSDPDPCGASGAGGQGFAGNLTGGDGAFAVQLLCEQVSDTSLITPPVDLTGLPSAIARFNSDFPCCFFAGQTADMDISADGGSTWSNVFHRAANARGPRVEQVDVSGIAAGKPDVRARFHFTSNQPGTWWQVDNVVLGQASCSLRSGGLVVGNVRDANTGVGLNGATVVNLPNDGSTTTFATPDDPSQDDGMYILFAGSGNQPFQASFGFFPPLTRTTAVIPNGTVRLDFPLVAGLLDASPRPLSARANPGDVFHETLTLSNTGGVDASFQIFSGGRILKTLPLDLAFPYGVLFNTDTNEFWISNILDPPDDLLGDNKNHRFLNGGIETGDVIDVSSLGLAPTDGAYNANTGLFWQTFGIFDIECIYEQDPATKALTGNSICPAFSSPQHALAYDPTTDTYYSGSLLDDVINHFDSSGTILDSAEVVSTISGLAFNPATGHLFVLHQDVGEGRPDVLVVDPTNAYSLLGGFFVGDPGTWGATVEGMEIDCAGRLWLVSFPGPGYVLEVDSGERGPCTATDAPWFSVSPASGLVPAGAELPVTVTFDATSQAPGLRLSQLNFTTDTPYPVAAIPIDLTVRFLDVPDGSFAENFIYGAAGSGIMPGCGGNNFCAAALVTRADMAGFIWRAVHGSLAPPPLYTGTFADVFFGDYNANYIQGLYDDGITAGCQGPGEPLRFCPTQPIPRAQMAVFIEKGSRGSAFVPPDCTGYFGDVPCPPTPSAPYANWVEALFNDGITVGCNNPGDPPAFCPDQQIPNDQMAVFLVKAFHLPHL